MPPVSLDGAVVRELLDMQYKWSQEVAEEVENELDRIEGRRFLLRTLALSVENYIEGWDPDAPHFRQTVSDIRKAFADSPDTDYLRSNLYLRDGRMFRVRGIVPPTTLYWGIQLYRSGGMVGKSWADTDIPISSKGVFEVFIVPPNVQIPAFMQGKKILVGDGDEVSLIVRQYFIDRTKEPPMRVTIDRVTDQHQHKISFMDDSMNDDSFNVLSEQGRIKVADFARGTRLTVADIRMVVQKTMLAHQYLSTASEFKFIIPEAKELFPTNDNRYTVAWVHGFEEQLPDPSDYPVYLVRGKRPDARYFSVVLYNRWLESLDYTRAIVYRNHTKLFFLPDGSFEVAVARRNPGHKNFLNTTHHNGVYILFRELLYKNTTSEFTLEQTTFKKLQHRADRTYLTLPSSL